jgi:hypothetical protein
MAGSKGSKVREEGTSAQVHLPSLGQSQGQVGWNAGSSPSQEHVVTPRGGPVAPSTAVQRSFILIWSMKGPHIMGSPPT